MGVENEINAISAFNKVGVEVEVEAELVKSCEQFVNKTSTSCELLAAD